MPSVGAEPPHANFDGDVKGIRDCLTNLVVDEGKEVILVSHSYTGIPAAEDPIGLAKSQREEKNLPGGVVRLVFINALAMPEGFQPTAGGAQFPAWMRIDKERGVFNVTPDDARAVFYNDISSVEADKWTAKIRPQSEGVYHSTTTYAAWRYIPSTFVSGSEDKTSITPELVSCMISSAQQQVPTAFDVVETCEGAGHCLMISRPEWLAAVMQRAAGDDV